MTNNGKNYNDSQLSSIAYQAIEQTVLLCLPRLLTVALDSIGELRRDEDPIQASRRTSPVYPEYSVTLDLTKPQMCILVMFGGNSPLTFADIATGLTQADCGPCSPVEEISELRKHGLLHRFYHEGDTRYDLTSAGYQIAYQLREAADIDFIGIS